jgi:putative ATP-dependent endonuclease of OLD family
VQIRRLKIKRFRGLKELVWHPGPGINCLTGPGDVGKSTALEAIATVLSPAPGRVASEYDYFDGSVDEGFVIEAVIGGLDDELLSAWSVAPLWTWIAEDRKAQADPDPAGEGVLCMRARGTEDLEIEHVVVDPSEGEIPLSPARRQLLGLSTMGAATTAFRELRMSRGSLLARNIERAHLRGLVTEAVQASRDSFSAPEDVRKRLVELSKALASIAPGLGDLALAILSPRGQNLMGMIGLFAEAGGRGVPVSNAGLGTQQLVLFTLARSLAVGSPLFVIDEIESGLEPFRQRELIARIRNAISPGGQAFMTTHSPAAIGELAIDELHRLDKIEPGVHSVVVYPTDLTRVKEADPESLLCRLPVLVEGRTELGLLDCLVAKQAAATGTTLGALGIRLVDGGGQPKVFTSTAALQGIGLRFGTFLDSEHEWRGKRKALVDDENVAFGTYSGGRCLEDALAAELELSELDALIALPGPGDRDLSQSRYQQLNALAGEQSRKTLVELELEIGDERCRDVFAKAANKEGWFKTREGGFAVGRFLLDRHPSSKIVTDVADFWTAAAGLIATHVPAQKSGDGGS